MSGRGQDWIAEYANHIDQERSGENLYTTWDGNQSFEESERNYYKQAYQAGLDATNERYRHEGHADRCKTVDDLYKGKLTRPEEMILQIGDRNSDVDGQSFKAAVEDYLGRLSIWNDAHGGHMMFLSAAIHLDEGSPHAHIRRVWEYQDAAGYTRLGQNKALQAAGIEPPQPEKPLGRYNNRKQTFDAMARGIWQETCREHGFDIETEARPDMRHKDKQEFIYSQMATEIDIKQQELTQATAEADRSRQEATKAAKAELEAKIRQRTAESDYKATEGKLRDAQAELEAIRERTRILTEQEARQTAKRGKSLFGLTLMHTKDYEALARAAEAAEQAQSEAATIKAAESKILEAAEQQRREIMEQAIQERDKAIADRDAAIQERDKARLQRDGLRKERDSLAKDAQKWIERASDDRGVYLAGYLKTERMASKLVALMEYQEGWMLKSLDETMDRYISSIPAPMMPDSMREMLQEHREQDAQLETHKRAVKELTDDLEL